MQRISGMNLGSYWLTNYFFDFLRCYIIVGPTIWLINAFDLGYEDVWIAFCVYPFAIIAFTYVSSFFFQRESIGMNLTVLLHIIFSAIGAVGIFYMRM
mmetsp:Transcript_2004/g.2478  ORF Transcript_2004/g.2478 Transcript_2004/m.2478 type:complete len:98 (+) Transcript_2004:139-432(+)